MLASEVSYVMSEMTANRGKAAYWGQFLKVCLLEVAKGVCPEKKVTLSPTMQPRQRQRDHRLGGKSQAAGPFFFKHLLLK